MKFIKKYKNINEGYFNSINDIKKDPSKYKVSTHDILMQTTKDVYIPRVIYYTYIAIRKYLTRTTSNKLLFSDIELKSGIKAQINYAIFGYDMLLLYHAGDYPADGAFRDPIKKASEEKIKNWTKEYLKVYFDNINGDFVPRRANPSPIKDVKIVNAEFIVTLNINLINSYLEACFFSNYYFDLFDKMEKEISNLSGFTVKIKLALMESKGSGNYEVNFPGRNPVNHKSSITFVGDIDYDKFIKFANRFTLVDSDTPIDKLVFFDAPIPSLNYLPNLPFKTHSIVFDKAWTEYGTNKFTYELDALGDYTRFLIYDKYTNNDGETSYPSIKFNSDAFVPSDIEKLSNGVIPRGEYEIAQVYDHPQDMFFCAFDPYRNLDLSPQTFQREYKKYSSMKK